MTQNSAPSTVTGKNLATATQTAPNYNRRAVNMHARREKGDRTTILNYRDK